MCLYSSVRTYVCMNTEFGGAFELENEKGCDPILNGSVRDRNSHTSRDRLGCSYVYQ